jgi:hypothetical protein
MRYYAAQGNAWRMFQLRQDNWSEPGMFDLVRVQPFSAISYAASGGFSTPQLYPAKLLPAVRMIERVLDRFPTLFATRMLVCLQRRQTRIRDKASGDTC